MDCSESGSNVGNVRAAYEEIKNLLSWLMANVTEYTSFHGVLEHTKPRNVRFLKNINYD